MLLFLEYDFIVVYKPGKTHVVTYALSRLLDITEPIGVLDQTTYASLFYTGLEWCKRIFQNRLDSRHAINVAEVEIG